MKPIIHRPVRVEQSLMKKKHYAIFMLIMMTYGIFGCSVPEPRPVLQEDIESIRPTDIIEKEKAMPKPGPPPFTEKLKPVTKGIAEESKLYSLAFDNAPLGEVIRAIGKDADLNMIVESEVDLSRPVTVNLKNVTFEEVLEMAVVKGAGYAWSVENGNLNIKRFEEKTYHFDYLDLAGETVIEIGGDMLASGVEESGVSGKYLVTAKREAKNTDVWQSIHETLGGLKSQDGILRIDRNAGIIYLADTPKNIGMMVSFLDSISEALHRQVFIEAKILEVSLSDASQYGIDWSKINAAFFYEDAENLPDKLSINFNRGGTLFRNDETSLSAVVDFLRTQGDVVVLSNPTLSIMNGQSAIMTVGFQFPFGDVSGVTESAETRSITFDTSIKRVVLGLQLGITPQIARNGVVTLHIAPTITKIQGDEDVEILTSQGTQSINNPIIDLQELSTTVRVKEGQTVVLAGLINQIRRLDHKGLPWISKIPMLGYLFKQMETSEEKRELVIFITPYIKEKIQ